MQKAKLQQLKKETQIAEILKAQAEEKRRREQEQKKNDLERAKKELEKNDSKVVKKVLMRDPKTKKILPPADFNILI